MRTYGRAAAILLAGITLAAVAAAANPGEWRVSDDDRWCREGGHEADFCEVREITIPAGREVIRVDGLANGGVRVEGWDRDEIRVRAKVQVWTRDDDEAEKIGRDIEIQTDNVIHAAGPDYHGRHRGWSVSYELMVPHKSNLDLEATNGGIAVADVTGEIRVEATNGGLRLSRLGGDVRGRTTNGGLAVELHGKRWDGAGLDVQTTNGGVTLEVPESYSAELETSTVNGGIEVEFPVTVQGSLSKNLRARLGDGGATLRVRTTNGGVHIVRG
jgi:hypothetical protein